MGKEEARVELSLFAEFAQRIYGDLAFLTVKGHNRLFYAE